jgi:hypothetical protein
MNILYVIIALAVIVLAVVLVAKFSFNVDLLNPASGEMSIAGRHTTANPDLARPTPEHLSYSGTGIVTITSTTVTITSPLVRKASPCAVAV